MHYVHIVDLTFVGQTIAILLFCYNSQIEMAAPILAQVCMTLTEVRQQNITIHLDFHVQTCLHFAVIPKLMVENFAKKNQQTYTRFFQSCQHSPMLYYYIIIIIIEKKRY